jgi:hypothetical protein
MAVAMQVLSLDTESIHEMVDTGELRWVWDVSSCPPVDAGRRELRFWMGELLAPGIQSSAAVGTVVACVIGHPTETRLRGHTVCQVLAVARPHLLRLAVTGELRGEVAHRVRWVDRPSLEAFLGRRLVT